MRRDNWGGIPSDRVVAVVATLANGRRQVGSGYLVTDHLVLTAWHCTVDEKTSQPATSLQVSSRRGGPGAAAALSAEAAELDVAVLAVKEPTWLVPVGSEPPRFGRVDRSRSRELLDCQAVGFPLWQLDPEDQGRNAAELHGTIRVTEDSEAGLLVMRDTDLSDVAIPGTVAAEDQVGRSPWGGLSGALVFYQGLALGVIIQQRPWQGASAMMILPVERFAAPPTGGNTDVAAVAAALGLPSAAKLPLAGERPPAARAKAITIAQLPGTTPGSDRTSYTAAELAHLYDFPAELDGTAQCIGIIELAGGYRMTDIRAYMKELGLKVPNVVSVPVDGARNSPGQIMSGDTQVTLDIEVAAGAAPGADIVVYFAPNTDSGFIDAIATAVADSTHNPSVLCVNWGLAEQQWARMTVTALNRALAAAAEKDITVCCGLGGGGATDGLRDGKFHVDFPASSPYVLACGGTRISVDGGERLAEVVWNDTLSGGVAGGGFSEVFPVPEWQRPVTESAYGYSEKPPGRGIPDVAANASPQSGYRILLDGQWSVVGGTAPAALWGGLIARMNQGLGRRIGLLNPVLYRSLGPAGILRDITEGSTIVTETGPLGYNARTGWDPCTGWGTPNGQQLLGALKVLQVTSQASDGAATAPVHDLHGKRHRGHSGY